MPFCPKTARMRLKIQFPTRGGVLSLPWRKSPHTLAHGFWLRGGTILLLETVRDDTALIGVGATDFAAAFQGAILSQNRSHAAQIQLSESGWCTFLTSPEKPTHPHTWADNSAAGSVMGIEHGTVLILAAVLFPLSRILKTKLS